MHRSASAFSAFWLLFAATLVFSQPPTADTYKAVKAGVVAVRWEGKTIGGGAIIDAKRGFIVSSTHVVAGAQTIKVKLVDGNEHLAKVLVADAASEIAILQFEKRPKDLVEIELAKSDPEPGEDLLVIGHPLRYEWSLSRGVVSATGRTLEINGGTLTGCFQHDAGTNPGSSGGPVLDTEGRLLGINTAVRQDAKAIAFAVPVSKVRKVLAMVKK